jgi:hypothetical protein
MTALGTADGTEVLDGASLQASIDALNATADALDRDIADAPDDVRPGLLLSQIDLRDNAMALNDARIRLMAGDLKITAGHIDAATKAATDAVATIADWNRKIIVIGKLVDFVGVVLTGNGTAILAAAFKLRDVLE